MIRGFLLAVALVLGPAQAAFAASPSAPRSDAEAEVLITRTMRELAAFAGPYQAAISAADELVLEVIGGADKAMDLYEADTSKADGRAWADSWEASVRARVVALRARTAQLPPFPEATFDRVVAAVPNMSGRLESYRQLRRSTETGVEVAIAFAENSITLVRRVAEGEDDALTPLAAEIIQGTKLSLGAENAMLDIDIASGAPDHPDTALSRSMKASNQAVELILDFQIAAILGQQVDLVASASAIRTKGEAARAAAIEIATLAARTGRRLDSMPDIPLKTRLLAMVETYRESSVVEIEIADILLRAADAIRSGELSSEALDALIAPLETSVDRRLAIVARRLQLMKS